jgi:hypothetical protein
MPIDLDSQTTKLGKSLRRLLLCQKRSGDEIKTTKMNCSDFANDFVYVVCLFGFRNSLRQKMFWLRLSLSWFAKNYDVDKLTQTLPFDKIFKTFFAVVVFLS